MWALLPFLASYITAICALVGLALGGPWFWLTPVVVFVGVPVLDAVGGLDTEVAGYDGRCVEPMGQHDWQSILTDRARAADRDDGYGQRVQAVECRQNGRCRVRGRPRAAALRLRAQPAASIASQRHQQAQDQRRKWG